MHRILFVCYGNICRSTMAESVMTDLVRRAGREGEFVIDSAGTHNPNSGMRPHPKTVRTLGRAGVPVVPHRARQVERDEYDDWDLVVGMDAMNVRDLRRTFDGDPARKVHLLLEYAPGRTRDVDDPWFTDDYAATYRDVLAGCQGLLAWVIGDRAG